MKYLLLLMLIIQPAFGYEVKYLPKGSVTTFEGYLIEPTLEKDMRYNLIELDYQKKLNTSLVEINNSYVENTKIMQTRLDLQRVQLEKSYENKEGFLGKFGYFLLGAATATLITFGVARSYQ